MSKSPAESVLVVDDDVSVAEMATQALVEAGFNAKMSLDANSAMDALSSNPNIGLLFTDVVMPRIDGFKLADMAKMCRPDLTILYATGYIGLAREISDAGETHGRILDKPYRPDQLVAAVRDALKQRGS
jgi:DNA-binding NtrC family response regulator